MSANPSLFDAPLPDPGENRIGAHHARARDTEVAAAIAITPRTGTWRRRVLDALYAAGEQGRTVWELHEQLGGALYTVAPRVNELLVAGWVEDSGRRRPTNTGKSAIVWRVSQRGIAQGVGA